jgi:hypothetical protein
MTEYRSAGGEDLDLRGGNWREFQVSQVGGVEFVDEQGEVLCMTRNKSARSGGAPRLALLPSHQNIRNALAKS